ncbi:MAG: hypothetical protein K2Q22_14475, partial [Cytophagales bacterium]|nr:hypothetical protein [Cytophagales bacterium]
STLFSALRVLGVAAGFLTISHFTQAQTLKTASGTANNFILTLGQNLGGSYPAGLSFTFISNQTITGAATLNVNGTGAINLVKNVNKPLVANDILAGQAVQVLYDGTNFQVLNVGSASTSTGAGTGNLYTFIATANVAPVPSYPSGGYGTNVIVYDTELYDTDNSYDPITGRFQPTSPGYYFLSGSGSLNGAGTNIAVGIFKNGIRYKDGGASFGASGSTAEVSSVVYANGTTDYFQIYMYNNSGSTQPLLVGNTSYNYFSGFKINGGGTLTVTSFTGSTAAGISTLNGLTTSSQSFSTSSTGTSVNIVSSGNTHNFNVPLTTLIGGNNITVTGTFPVYTISGLASTSTGAGTGNLHAFKYAMQGILSSSTCWTNADKLPYSLKQFDTNNDFDPLNYRFQPNEPGYYYLFAQSRGPQTTTQSISIFQNDVTQVSQTISIPEIGPSQLASTFALVYANGTTDYFDVRACVGYFDATWAPNYFAGFKINGGGTLTVTSFTGSTASGISTLNGLTTPSQNFSTSSTGTSVNIVSSGNTHNFNIPLASVVGGNNITVTGSFPLYTISGLAGGMSTSQWVSTTGGIYYNGGNVGIGTGNPLTVAHINSNSAGIGKGLLISGNNGALNLGDVFGGNPLTTPTWSMDNVSGQFRIYSQPNLTTSGTVWMSITSTTGAITFPSLGSGSTKTLGVNSVGHLVTIPGATPSLSSLNNLTTTSQSFSTSSTGTSVNIVSSGNTHNFNIPLASVVGGNNITVTGSFPLYTISGLAGGTSTSQWVSTTGGIYYNGGNVGIGNITPNESLTIQGNTSATGIGYMQSLSVFQTGNQASFLRTDATVAAQNYIEFWTGRYSGNVTRNVARWQLGLNQGATPSDDDFFGVGRNGIGYDFKINRKGFVGIGTPGFYPQAMLDVEGDARIGGLM